MIDIEIGDWEPLPKALRPGQAVFAIGDVHGHAAQLKALQDHIRARICESYTPEKVTVVWLGDYIDRGPAPLEVLDLVRRGLWLKGLCEVRLRGNHEQFLIDFLDAPLGSEGLLRSWLMNGGWDTISAMSPGVGPDKPLVLAVALREALGAQRLAFLRHLALLHREGDYVFAHAGINPQYGLEAQVPEDLIWIRDSFLNAKTWPHDVVVVHGHTPERPCVMAHRIGIDSGVFFTGQLTALELAGEGLRFITASGPGAQGLDKARFFD